MDRYCIRDICADDYSQVVAIYNANPRFLTDHLGVEAIDEAFISREVSAMRKAGFRPCVIINGEKQTVRGVLDYRPGKEAYLSLLMLAADLQGKGAGCRVYSCFESEMLQLEDSVSIRIDAVNDCFDNAIPFWKKLGFSECESVTLEWGKKKSRAVVMRKNIRQ